MEINKIVVKLIFTVETLMNCKSNPINWRDDRRAFIFQIGANEQYDSSEQDSDMCPIIGVFGEPTDCGRGISCSKGNSTPFEFWWCPKVIDPRKFMTFYSNIKLPFSVANITATVDVHMFQESKPMFTLIQEATCEQLKEDLAQHDITITCPLQEGAPIKTRLEIGRIKQLPTGKFTIILNVENESHKKIVCIELRFEIRRN